MNEAHTSNNPRRILIVLMGSLGDVVRGMSLVSPIKTAYPKCELSWLVEPKCEGIVKLNPKIDNVILFDRRRPLKSLLGLAGQLKRAQFDLVLDLQRHLKSGLFSWLTRAPRRIGFHRANAKEFNWLFNNEQIGRYPADAPKLEHYLKFLEKIGVEYSQPRVDFSLEDGMRRSADTRARLGEKYCAVVLGSSWPSKDWPAEGYLKLLQLLLAESQMKVALLGDGGQLDLSGRLESSAASERVINLAGRTALDELVAVVSRAAFCIGPDSGPGHIAGALGVPYISLFGPTSDSRTAPHGSRELVVKAHLGCMPCYRRKCPGLDRLCMRLISAEAVMQKARQFIAGGV
ncbi:MAG: glycosyltransferase family 9 protein [Deltaproteobacteria bacterium]|nr:glycosyltransferase family 9 protein [Deltaproteobacteria bacterium]